MQSKTVPVASLPPADAVQGKLVLAPQLVAADASTPERCPCPPAPPASGGALSGEIPEPHAHLLTPSGTPTKGLESAAISTSTPAVSPGGDARLVRAGVGPFGGCSPSWASTSVAAETCAPSSSGTHVARTASCAPSSSLAASAAVGSEVKAGAAAASTAEVGPGTVRGVSDIRDTRYDNVDSMAVVPGPSAACSEVASWDGGACARLMTGASSTETNSLPPTSLWAGSEAQAGSNEGGRARRRCAELGPVSHTTAVDEAASQAAKKARLTSPKNAFAPLHAAESCKLPKSERQAACWVECYKCRCNTASNASQLMLL